MHIFHGLFEDPSFKKCTKRSLDYQWEMELTGHFYFLFLLSTDLLKYICISWYPVKQLSYRHLHVYLNFYICMRSL